MAIALSLLVGTRFQVLLTPLAGVLFTFPSRYWFTIGRRLVFSLGRWSSRIPTGFHVSRGTQVPVGSCHHFRLRGYHPLWPAVPGCSTSGAICNSTMTGPTTPPNPKTQWFGLFRIRSPLLTESLLFSFPPGTEMVHFPGFASYDLCIQSQILRFCRSGFPHSETPGSTPACGFPRIIAACHVLHRLPSPRHPPCALSSLITTNFCLRRSLYS